MDGLSSTTWAAVLMIRRTGKVWTVMNGDRHEAVMFATVDAAERFARILTNSTELPHRAVLLEGETFRRWLDALTFADQHVLLEPEYVLGRGIVGDPAPVGEFRSAVAELIAA